MSVRSIWSDISLKSDVSLLVFCLDGLFIVEHGILKPPNCYLLLSISSSRSVNICFIYLDALIFGAYVFEVLTMYTEEGELCFSAPVMPGTGHIFH